jgi:hypothetical protein
MERKQVKMVFWKSCASVVLFKRKFAVGIYESYWPASEILTDKEGVTNLLCCLYLISFSCPESSELTAQISEVL